MDAVDLVPAAISRQSQAIGAPSAGHEVAPLTVRRVMLFNIHELVGPSQQHLPPHTAHAIRTPPPPSRRAHSQATRQQRECRAVRSRGQRSPLPHPHLHFDNLLPCLDRGPLPDRHDDSLALHLLPAHFKI